MGLLLERQKGRLRRMVELRLDPRLRARLGASDVLQEACLDALRRLEEYFRSPTMPFFLWLRFITSQKLLALHEHHFGARRRDPRREARPLESSVPEATSGAIASLVLDSKSSPEEKAERAELRSRIEDALNRMDAVDREVLALRHFEQLTNSEAAQVLGIRPSAASKRYLRAARRLRGLLRGVSGPGGETWD